MKWVYAVKGKYYNQYNECDRKFYCLIVAEDYTDAMEQVLKKIPNLISVTIAEDPDSDDFIWLSKKNYEKFISEGFTFDPFERDEQRRLRRQRTVVIYSHHHF